VAKGISEIIFENQRSSWKFGDYGLITKKPRGLFANFPGYLISNLFFDWKNLWA
jgi:hypothetical protein